MGFGANNRLVAGFGDPNLVYEGQHLENCPSCRIRITRAPIKIFALRGICDEEGNGIVDKDGGNEEELLSNIIFENPPDGRGRSRARATRRRDGVHIDPFGFIIAVDVNLPTDAAAAVDDPNDPDWIPF